jgi:amino acid adenylation domain-containing protein
MLIGDFLTHSRHQYPDKIACVCGEQRLTYRELDQEANQFAHVLMESGLESGDRVAIWLENQLECIITIFGIAKAGGAFVVINPTTKPDKLAYMLNDCTAHALVAQTRSLSGLPDLFQAVPSLRAAWSCGAADTTNHLPRGVAPFAPAMAAASPLEPERRCIDMDLAAIIYTSGTTGKPKGIAMTHLNMVSASTAITSYLENRPDDIILNVLPLSFDYGLYQVLMAAHFGGTLILERSFAYPYRVVQQIPRENVTGFPGVPTMFAMLLQMKDIAPETFDSVRYVTNTGAALPPKHLFAIRDRFRHARVYSMYGVSECKRVSYLPPEDLDTRPGSVGCGMPNEQVWIVDEDGHPVPPGTTGELVVRGANVMRGYWGLPEKTAEVLRPGRYPWEKVLYTGDLFRADEEGYLYFVARKDDIIKSRGEKVSPREVEAVLCEHPGVKEACVVGLPDEILGQAIAALVAPAPGHEPDAHEIIAHCTRRLENFMVPKLVRFCDQLPRNPNGKIRKEEVLRQLSHIPKAVES